MPSQDASPPRPHRGIESVVERYFDVSLYLLIVTGFVTLSSTGKLDPFSVGVVSLALVARGILLVRGVRVVIPEKWTSYFTVAYVLFYAADFLFLSGSFVAATTHLLLFVVVVKLFAVQRDRDHLYLIALSFGSVLVAAILTVDSVFFGAFLLFVLLAVSTFISMEMRRSSRATANCAREPQDAGRRVARSLSGTSTMLMLGILVAASGMFFLLPRLSAGYLKDFAARGGLISGFSNDVRLGEIGEIKRSSTVIMHIQVEDDAAGRYDLKWRGVALSNFDGRHWFNPTARPAIVVSPSGRFDLNQLPAGAERLPARRGYHLLRYRVLMEPVGINVFFFAPVARTLVGKYREISLDDAGSVYNDDRRLIDIYDAVSDIAPPSPAALRQAGSTYPPGFKLVTYTQHPRDVERIRGLAQQVTANAPTPYDKAAAIERYLRTNYGYSLEMYTAPNRDPLEYFLFERKQGHCEYFASAMALMLRTLGIPSRIVNGFRTGEFNDVTGSYIIRGRDAHSWVEVYFPGYGWVGFDPTPPDPKYEQSSWSRMMLYLDAAGEFWREWVVNYDFLHQQTLGNNAVSRGRESLDRARLWLRHQYELGIGKAYGLQERANRNPRRWGMTAVGLALLLLLAINARAIWRWYRRRRLAAAPERAPRKAATIWYERMTRSVARRGWPKQPAQTPLEFTRTIEDAALRAVVERFTERYERARFADSPEDARLLPELFEEIASRN